ncbi:MAG: rod shape-determining protein MreD [Balneolaceae bacterium]
MIRSENIRYIFIGLFIIAIQVILLRHLKVYGGEADLVLIYLLWIATHRNRTETLLFAAGAGLLQDAMTDLWGLNLFSKTLLIFLFHGYLNKISENRFILWQIFLILLITTIVHNAIFVFVSSFAGIYATSYAAGPMLIAGSLYTALTGSFLYLTRS